ncbi:D-hexose-6-phosphate mutarotase [Hahella sp. SMD15-11]|uniref:Putative glucose-6-phosphate 1-epimerase n=1 Tax=Thermohahella caldifontis TaxID=3142973 RepID=A0AB39UZQ6_9GAMM
MADHLNSGFDRLSAMSRRWRTVRLEHLGELPVLHIRRGKHECWVSLQGAQVLGALLDGKPAVWANPAAEFKAGQAIRSGIPLCWPWFGDLNRNPQAVRGQYSLPQPAHGFARTLPFALTDVVEHAHVTEVEFSLRHRIGNQSLMLAVQVRLGNMLEVTLSTYNGSEAPFALSTALHTYLPVTDIEQARIHGLGDRKAWDACRDWQPGTLDDPLVIRAETDWVCPNAPETVTLIDPQGESAIKVNIRADLNGEPRPHALVIWNPWTDKARRLGQFRDEDYRHMLCLEAALAAENCVTLGPGEQLNLTTAIENLIYT